MLVDPSMWLFACPPKLLAFSLCPPEAIPDIPPPAAIIWLSFRTKTLSGYMSVQCSNRTYESHPWCHPGTSSRPLRNHLDREWLASVSPCRHDRLGTLARCDLKDE